MLPIEAQMGAVWQRWRIDLIIYFSNFWTEYELCMYKGDRNTAHAYEMQ